MKFISFNINSLRARLHQIDEIIAKHQPDVIGLQETKVHDDMFPVEEIEQRGYHVCYHGQKGHYGVAILTKVAPIHIQKGFPTDTDDAQRRMIMVTLPSPIGEIKVINGYFPQGENREHETKFPAKAQFYADLMRYLQEHESAAHPIIIMGDMNISPKDKDIGIGENNMKRWLKTGKCSFLPEEREWMEKLMNWGVIDTYRQQHPDLEERYSWFDYRSKGFDDNRGLRIDLILATESLAKYCTDSGIDYDIRAMEKPSDHAPIWSTFKFK